MMDAELIDALRAGDGARARNLLAQDSSTGTALGEPSALLTALYMRLPDVAQLIAERRPRLTLHESAALGDLRSAKAAYLTDPGAVAMFAGDGFTPLHLASFFDRPALAEWLLAEGAPVNVAARNGMKVTPLHSAAAAGSVQVCRLLLERGAAPDAAQHEGYTALHAASLHGNVELVELLLDYGADPSLAADNGQDAAAFARKGKHARLAEKLESAGRGANR